MLFSVLFAFSIAGPGVPCAHAAVVTSQKAGHDGHAVRESTPSVSHALPDRRDAATPATDALTRAQQSDAPTQNPQPERHPAPLGCTVLMSCGASVSATRVDAIDVGMQTTSRIIPVGPVLQSSVADRDVESPPPRS